MVSATEILIKVRESLEKRPFATLEARNEAFKLLGWLIGPPHCIVSEPPKVHSEISASTAELVCGLVAVQLPPDDSLSVIQARIGMYRSRIVPVASATVT